MDIIIVGCGKIGTTIISSLLAEGHNLTVVDTDPEVLSEITNIYDVMGVCGNGADCDTLSEAAVEKAELVVSVTGSDEFNMLSCFLARRMGAKHTIARIRNPEYNDNERSLGFMRQQLDISMAINPDHLAAKELYNILKLPSALKIETFSGRNFEMVELMLRPDSKLDGLRLIDMRKKYQAKFLVCVVKRGDQVFIPDGNFVLKSGDKIGISATPVEIQKLLKMLGILQRQARDVIIMGGSRMAYYLSKMLLSAGNAVKIIERDVERCKEICETLPNAVVIHGDGAQQELLLEEGLKTTDAFVALTGMDEENILISIFAQSQNVPKVISKINRDEFASMAEKLGVECIVSPKHIISDVLLRYVRALENSIGSSKVEKLYQLMDGTAEALEFNVFDDFGYFGIKLKDLKLKPNILIAGIIRGRRTAIIPDGETSIQPKDKVVVIAGGHKIQDLTDIIR